MKKAKRKTGKPRQFTLGHNAIECVNQSPIKPHAICFGMVGNCNAMQARRLALWLLCFADWADSL